MSDHTEEISTGGDATETASQLGRTREAAPAELERRRGRHCEYPPAHDIQPNRIGEPDSNRFRLLKIEDDEVNVTDDARCGDQHEVTALARKTTIRSRDTEVVKNTANDSNETLVGKGGTHGTHKKQHQIETSPYRMDDANSLVGTSISVPQPLALQGITVLQPDPVCRKDEHGRIKAIPRLDHMMERQTLNDVLGESSIKFHLDFISAVVSLHGDAAAPDRILHISTLGLPDAVTLEDETHVGMLKRVPLGSLKQIDAKLCFLSSCHARSIGMALVKVGRVPHVVCCQRTEEGSDDASFLFTFLFYKHIFSGKMDLQEAFAKARDETLLRYGERMSDHFCLLPDDDSQHRVMVDLSSISERPLDFAPAHAKSSPLPPTSDVDEGLVDEQLQVLIATMSLRFVDIIGQSGVGVVRRVCSYLYERKKLDSVGLKDIVWCIYGDPENTMQMGMDSAFKRDIQVIFHSIRSDDVSIRAFAKGNFEAQKCIDSLAKYLENDRSLLIIDAMRLRGANEASKMSIFFESLLLDAKQLKLLVLHDERWEINPGNSWLSPEEAAANLSASIRIPSHENGLLSPQRLHKDQVAPTCHIGQPLPVVLPKPSHQYCLSDIGSDDLGIYDGGSHVTATTAVNSSTAASIPHIRLLNAPLPRIIVLTANPLGWLSKSNREFHPLIPNGIENDFDIVRDSVAPSGIDIEHRIFTKDTLSEVLVNDHTGILHLACHGNDMYLAIENQSHMGLMDSISRSEIKEWIDGRGEHVKLVFVAANHSAAIGKLFAQGGVPHVICYDLAPLQDAAASFVEIFYSYMANGDTIQVSFDRARSKVQLMHGSSEGRKFLILPNNEDHDIRIIDHAMPGLSRSFLPSTSRESGSYTSSRRHTSTPLIGRRKDQYQLIRAVSQHRIVSVTGVPGIGKTELVHACSQYLKERAAEKNSLVDGVEWLHVGQFSPDVDIRYYLFNAIFKSIGDNSVSIDQCRFDTRKLMPAIEDWIGIRRILLVIEAKSLTGDMAALKLSLFIHALLDSLRDVRIIVVHSDEIEIKESGRDFKPHRYLVPPLDFDSNIRLLESCLSEDIFDGSRHGIENAKELCDWLLETQLPTIRASLAPSDPKRQLADVIYRLIGAGVPRDICDVGQSMSADDLGDLISRTVQLDMSPFDFDRTLNQLKHELVEAVQQGDFDTCVSLARRAKDIVKAIDPSF